MQLGTKFLPISKALERKIPTVQSYFDYLNLQVETTCFGWVGTIFTHEMYNDYFVTRTWDMFILLGYQGLLNFIVAIFKQNEDKILKETDYGDIIYAIKEIPESIDIDRFLKYLMKIEAFKETFY